MAAEAFRNRVKVVTAAARHSAATEAVSTTAVNGRRRLSKELYSLAASDAVLLATQDGRSRHRAPTATATAVALKTCRAPFFLFLQFYRSSSLCRGACIEKVPRLPVFQEHITTYSLMKRSLQSIDSATSNAKWFQEPLI